MVDATVSFAIEKLNDFITQQVNIRIGVKDGVRWLKDELGYLQSSVRVAEEHNASKQEIDLIRQWINNVRDVADDAVTILERFSYLQEEHTAPKQGILHRMCSAICMCKKETDLYDIGKDIESLKGRVVEINNRREAYGIANILATPMVQKRKRSLLRATSFENLVDVVGFEDHFETLLAELVKEDPSLNVISIHGMGGLGKTTLASKLYYSSELSHFDSRAWVCVSQDYDIIHVLKKLIRSFDQKHEPDLLNMDEVDLLRNLHKLLQGRDHYLAVIDDIWDVEVWEKIKKAFPDKKNGSRVIITTRNKSVAQRVHARCFVYQLNFLSGDESWQLFYNRAKPTRNLEKLGKEMVGKCGGLPLAIVVLSGLLLSKKSYEDWSKVKDHIWRHLQGESLEIQEILNLSYDDLSFQMKQCFLYLARFPEDHVFEVEKLKLLWIVEEFIIETDEGDGEVMEDVADDCLNELINRNMVNVARLFLDGQVQECRVHDVVHDFAVRRAAEHRLLGIFDSCKHPSPVRLLKRQPRHAIYNGISKYLELHGASSEDLKLRSLAVINGSKRDFKLEEIKVICTRFKYVRVLDLTAIESEGIPEEIGDLVLLKFLGLMGGKFGETLVIPPTIGKLKKLQILSGMTLSSAEYEFPREVLELKELKHVIFPYITHGTGSLNIGSNQTKLQSLYGIRYEDWIQIDTLNLTNLRALTIIDKTKGGDEYSLESIAKLTSLHTFILDFYWRVIPTLKPLSSCKCLKRVILNGKMIDTSELCSFPDSVTDLALRSSEFTEDPMPILGSLTNLTGLELFDVYMGKKMACSHNAFQSLQFLTVKSLLNLEEWHVDDNAMPSLKGFYMSNCENLKIVPRRITCVAPLPRMFHLDESLEIFVEATRIADKMMWNFKERQASGC